MSEWLATLRARLGLSGRAPLSWALYDWANSGFATVVLAAVLPVYYVEVAGATLPGSTASIYWGYTLTASFAVIAVLSPVLGAVADRTAAKKRFLGAFVILGVVATSLLFFAERGDWLSASVAFALANVGFAGANMFYNSLLPHVTERMDALSTAGYALGYFGGGLLLVINLIWILNPGLVGLPNTAVASRIAMLSVALWWLLFSIPLFYNVDEPAVPGGAEPVGSPIVAARTGLGRLRSTAGQVRQYRQVLLFLLAFWLYNDGISTIITLSAAYATDIGLGQSAVVGALVIVQFAGVPFAFGFGSLADRIGAKPAISLGLVVYIGIAICGYFMTEAWHFFALAVLVATVQGGTQALSRSLYGSMVPADRTSEFYSFYNVSSKFASIVGPLLFSVIGQVTGSTRLGILSLLVLFGGGLILLARVDVEAGRTVAQAAGGPQPSDTSDATPTD
ncbi:MFS transporter [Halorientalis sp.]|jgi:UMF1 family MFS transporter|uniref:MFS transporter n=1 Tax=Halorientalis sp. TaxID=1931229 RepID=UPI002603CA25|nr:MFS transporter [Halorientalis sp.]